MNTPFVDDDDSITQVELGLTGLVGRDDVGHPRRPAELAQNLEVVERDGRVQSEKGVQRMSQVSRWIYSCRRGKVG